jgi:hypothetical protein
MNKRLIRFTLVLGIAFGLGAGVRSAQAEQHPKSATTKGATSRGGAGEKDDNVKQDRAPNDPSAKTEAPPQKGGAKTRQYASCQVHIDNHTPWYIDIYTDGDYRGQVSPWGDSYGYVGCGGTAFYGRATFIDRSVKTWGPASYYVVDGFTWDLE